MNEILSAVLGSMHGDLARVDRVAMNLANVQTPGFKREIVSALPFAARLADGDGSNSISVHVDQRPGTLKPTGQRLDVALAGDGWFEVATNDGAAYTRQGNFRLDARGRLVTQKGDPVLGNAGEIQLVHGAPVIDTEGRVYEGSIAGDTVVRMGEAPVAHLKVVRFAAGAAMSRSGDGLVTTTSDTVPVAEGTAQVQQGYLENSNVSHMQEMVRLMASVRHLESMQKVAVAYDEMLANSIRKLGEQ